MIHRCMNKEAKRCWLRRTAYLPIVANKRRLEADSTSSLRIEVQTARAVCGLKDSIILVSVVHVGRAQLPATAFIDTAAAVGPSLHPWHAYFRTNNARTSTLAEKKQYRGTFFSPALTLRAESRSLMYFATAASMLPFEA